MCGIYGILGLRGGGSPEQSWIDAMANLAIHRGPDDSGIHVDGELAIGIRRLSVIDWAGGHQPITNEDDTVSVICNGEIHNFRAQRSRRSVEPAKRYWCGLLAGGGDFLRQLVEVDAATQLPDDLPMPTDRTSMAVSLECRVPLLDTHLVELTAQMPAHLKIRGRQLKYILKKSLGGVLPKDILHRKKRGFGAPMGAWLREDLSKLLRAVLCRETIERRGLLNWHAVERTIDLHAARKEDYTDHLSSLMYLEIWLRLYVDEVDHQDLTAQLTDLAA